MSLDYRTPRQPKKPCEQPEGVVFARYSTWTVQRKAYVGDAYLIVAKRHTWSAAYEFAMGYLQAAHAAISLGEVILIPDYLALVGPDGLAYELLDGGAT